MSRIDPPVKGGPPGGYRGHCGVRLGRRNQKGDLLCGQMDRVEREQQVGTDWNGAGEEVDIHVVVGARDLYTHADLVSPPCGSVTFHVPP